MGRFGGVLEGIGCPEWEDCDGGGIAAMVIVDCDCVVVKQICKDTEASGA